MLRAVVLTSGLLAFGAGLGLARPPVPKAAVTEKKVRTAPLAFPQLLLDENVREILEISAEQGEAIDQQIKKYCADEEAKQNAKIAKLNGGAGMPGAGGIVPPLVSDIDADDMRMAIQSADGREKVLKPILEKAITGAQADRLRQIDLQLQGPNALLNRRAIRALKLTEDQEDKVEDAVRDYETAVKQWWDNLEDEDDPTDDEWEKLAGCLEKSSAKSLEILTPAQRKEWKNQLGKPVDLTEVLPGILQRGIMSVPLGGILGGTP